ncbi:TasA family protein [Halobaculum litoreum]|uniref:TasA family protein n=1 Tax=Halobaculum litoreum TaxID=3031998 RepID=UPI0024C26D42|nr:TasA family protein [Halobaculum sp. DT92]
MVPDLPGTIGRRRLLSSLGVLGAASAASGIGTWALLSDTERTTGSVTAGTLDLRVGDGGTATLAIDDAAPGDAGVATVPVANDGTVAGTLGLTVVDVRPSAPGGGSGADAERSGGPVADVAFRGCGKAVVEFAADAVFPVELDVHERRGNGETVDETRTVEAAETTPATGGRRRTTLTRSRGKLVAVGVDDRTWTNPNPCATDGASGDGASVALAKALSVDAGYAADEAAAGADPLVRADPAWDLSVPARATSDRTLAPGESGGSQGSTAVLYVAWSIDADPAEPVAGGTVEIELRPEIHR